MPYFRNNRINLLFIHIPKTGGTSIEKFFSQKYNIPLNKKSLFGNHIHLKSSLQHMTYFTIYKNKNYFNIHFKNLKILAAVRNPYDRIVSDLFFLKKININTTPEQVFTIIKKFIVDKNVDNHNLPQHTFVTTPNKKLIPNIKIINTESLNDDMKKLGYLSFNNFANRNKKNEIITKQLISYNSFLNSDSINLINKIYHLDFVLFNYKKLI